MILFDGSKTIVKIRKYFFPEIMLRKAQSHIIVVSYFSYIIALEYQGSVMISGMFRYKVYFENAIGLCIK